MERQENEWESGVNSCRFLLRRSTRQEETSNQANEYAEYVGAQKYDFSRKMV